VILAQKNDRCGDPAAVCKTVDRASSASDNRLNRMVSAVFCDFHFKKTIQ